MSLEAIGQKLKSARESQGLSLRQIYERTKIPINHLQAIDTGQPDDLPEPVYVAGFIKRYAECIGLDGQVLADEYRRLDSNGNGKPRAMPAQPVYVTADYLKHARIDNRAPSYKLWPFYAVVIIGVIAVLSWYFKSQALNAGQVDPSTLSLRDSLAHLPAQAGVTTATTSAGAPDAAAATATAVATTPAGNNDANKLVLSATQHVWVDVKKVSSGDSLFTGFLEQGDTRTFEDPQGLRVTAGNGGSLSSTFNGKTEPLGAAGHRVEKTFTPENANAAGSPTDKPASALTPGTTGGATASATSAKTAAVKRVKKADAVRTTRRWSDDGTRSIPGMGGDGMRSIDVPYRYSEGRLD
jgi:cytoskeletal protein RodZ